MNAERRVYRKALAGVLIAAGVITIGGAAIAWAVSGAGAAGAAALGGVVSGLAAVATPASMLLGRERPAHVFAATVAGVWLAKMFILVAIVAVLSKVEGFEREAFGWALMAGVITSLAIDVWAVRSTRVPYVAADS